MNFKKSMISIAAASLLAVGFTGCNGGDEAGATTVDNDGIVTQINTPKGTVTGTVMDTNGNPLSGVKIYVAGMEATTDNGGIYTFTNVPVTTTNTQDGGSETIHGNLLVTIAAPTGYLGANVTVKPEAQIEDSNNSQTIANGETEAVANTTFIDGFIAQAGTAVLPALTATVTGKLENLATEAPIANQSISLDFTGVNTTVGANVAQPQNGVATSYATGNYTATTDASGNFTITNVPNDSDLTYVVGNHTVNGEEAAQGIAPTTGPANDNLQVTTNNEVEVVNIGDLQVTPIVNEDNVAPRVASVTSGISSVATTVNGNASLSGNALMLEDDVREIITINFTETIAPLSENDVDNTTSVTVYDWTNSTYITPSNIEIGNSSVTITLPNALTDGQEIDVNLLKTDFKDAAGNMLALDDSAAASTPAAMNDADFDDIDDELDYVSDRYNNQEQAVRVSLKAYNDLNTNAVAVTNEDQMTTDTVGITADGFDTQRNYSNAFNDVNLPDNNIQQLNAPEAEGRLDNLAALQSAGMDVEVNSARITFDPSGAASYNLTVKNSLGVDQTVNIDANRINVANSNPTFSNNNAANGNGVANFITDDAVSTVELVLDGVNIGDVVTITPLDDFGYAGTPKTITLVDNVAPTTVLQESYMGGAGVSAAAGVVVPFGDGGELTNDYGQTAGVGTPILAVTPGLLDNLYRSGTTVIDIQADTLTTQATSDNNLEEELSVYNGTADQDNDAATAPTRVISAANVYDATAFAVFNTDAKLTRNIGVAFSEDVDLTDVTPTYAGTAIDAAGYKVINDVTVDDDNNATYATNEANVGNNIDLVEFTTTNVFTLANENHGQVLSFDGIKDSAGNASTNADVVLHDRMPPFVTKASYDGDLTIVFNEAITAPTDAAPVNITVANANNTDSRVIQLTETNRVVANNVQWSLSTDAKTLTIGAGVIDDTTNAANAANSLRSLFNAGEYIETTYDSVAREHAILSFNDVQDAASGYTNSWDKWNTAEDATDTNEAGNDDDMATPQFAVIDMIGDFTYVTDDTGFKINTDANAVTQQIVWTFTHPIDADSQGGASTDTFFDVDDAGVSLSATTNIITATNAAIATAWNGVGTNLYTQILAGTDSTPIAFNAAGSTINNANTTMTLSSDRKTVTLTFRTDAATNVAAGDKITFEGTSKTKTAFRSSLDDNEKLKISGTAQN